MARRSPSHDDKHMSVASSVAEFVSGVLRQGESYLFYQSDESELNAVLNNSLGNAFSCKTHPHTPLQSKYINLGLYSTPSYEPSYTSPAAGFDTKYMFVVRAMLTGAAPEMQASNPRDDCPNRVYYRRSQVLPEFLVSFQLTQQLCQTTPMDT